MLIGTKELCDRTGASYRQIDYWCTIGLIAPLSHPNPGSGARRKFEEEIVPRVRYLAILSNIFRPTTNRSLMRKIYGHYEEGRVDLENGIILTWRTDDRINGTSIEGESAT